MNKFTKKISLLLIVSLLLLAFAACGKPEEFTHSTGIDENGMWEGVTALDNVTLCDYNSIIIPEETLTVSEEEMQEEIDYYLSEHTLTDQITDRAVQDGDTVNIDYVGSIDGVEFDGGSTGGAGTDVIIGYTSYIDDFLEQLIGQMPGTTVNVEVTFPENYGTEEMGNAFLNGKDAVFVTTINYIVEYSDPVLSDSFVSESLSADYGWTTVAEMKQEISEQLVLSKVAQFLQNYIIENSTVNTLPESMMTYQENSLVLYYKEYAKQVNMEYADFLTTYLGITDESELIEANKDVNRQTAEYYLLAQAIIEDAGLSVTDEDVSEYFRKYFDTEDYSQFETVYGKPYIKLTVLNQHMLDYLQAGASAQ